MFRPYYFVLGLLFLVETAAAQKWEIGADMGRAYFHYQYKDYGQGYRNDPRANRGLTAALLLQRDLNKGLFLETGIRFALYEQYYSARLYGGTWEQSNPVFFIPALAGYRSKGRSFFSARGGLLLGVMPDQYEARYYAFFQPSPTEVDSVTRGTMKRNFTPVFPLVSLELGIGYRIGPRCTAELRMAGVKGFTTITEYDIYYNDGSGRNDQRARQWGKGDYASLTLGLRYGLRSK